MRSKIPALREALKGRFDAQHALIVSETGADMSVFASAKHLASWAGQCPGNDESAGKRRSGRTRKGSRWLGIALTEAALAATRQQDTYLGAQYWLQGLRES